MRRRGRVAEHPMDRHAHPIQDLDLGTERRRDHEPGGRRPS
jgi:hypothetical protein